MTFKRLFFTCLLVVTSSVSFAYDFSAVAPSGQTLYYNIVDGHAEVVRPGMGDIYYNYVTGDVVIPASVEFEGISYAVLALSDIGGIGSSLGGAFCQCSGLTSVTIPNSVTSIGNNAFYQCTGLTSITMGDSVTTIGHNAFSGCSSLTSIIIPNSVTSIGGFRGCSSLTSITIGNSVTTIGDFAFYQCTGLTSITMGDSVTTIGDYAFYQCTGLTSITMGDSVTTIGQNAFRGCSSLTSIIIPNSVTSIGGYAFCNCSSLTSITIGNSVTTIDDYAFNNCSGLTSIAIPATVTSIGKYAFDYCSGLTSIVVEDDNTYYDSRDSCNAIIQTDLNYLVRGCNSTIIPNTVATIGNSAFSGCSSLSTITIPASVTFIDNYAFGECSNLTEIHSMANVAPTLSSSSFTNTPSTIPVFIPCGSSISYYSRWSYFSNFIEDEGFSFSVLSADSTQGGIAVQTQPTCQIPIAIFHAMPNSGYRFDHWSDNNTDNPRMLALIQDTSIIAYFEPNAELYNVVANNSMGGGMYESGSTATLFALPQVDLQFAGWSDNMTTNPRHIVVTSDTMLTALYRAPDTLRIYDTTTVYDTVINMVYDTTEYNHYYYDTTEYNHYYYDTTRIYDTLVVFDTTRVFDTMVYISIDTLHHYYYDTTRIYDTLVVFDTTRVFDTMVYINTDTLHHYYYDTTRVYDTLVVFDTTRVFDTLVYVNIDTLHHYYYDTTRIYDTVVFLNVDTLNHYYYDTTSVTHYIFDSTWVFDSVWIFDSVYIFDTIYIHDTIVVGVDEVDVINAKIYTSHGQIVVNGAESNTVWLYDVNGRILATKQDEYTPLHFDVPASGAYLIKIGNHPARKVVVVR